MKTLKIEQTTHQKLSELKAKTGAKTLDETINNLLYWWDWWKQPGTGRGKGDGNK